MTRQALALSLLEEAGSRGVTTAEFMDAGVGSRYSARLLELRKQGHRITSERVREGSWRYVLDADVGGDGDWAEDSTLRPDGVRAGADRTHSPHVTADVSAEALKLFESAA